MSSHDDMEFMDIDGPEFLADVNNEIANIRASRNDDVHVVSSDIFTSHSLDPHNDLGAYQELCVLDTNFLISKLGYLDTVLTLADQRPGSLLVLLPWVVIRELDGLKTSRNGDSESEICLRARKAMRFIELRLREKSISLRGQKMNEILDPAMSSGQGIKGDDRILDCCMYFQQLTGKTVTLLSNDRNLCIKVMVHEVESISAESTPKMEALLNRIGGISSSEPAKRQSVHSHIPATKQQQQQHPKRKRDEWTIVTNHPHQHTENNVMEVDGLEHHNNNHHQPTTYVIEEDYDMMIDDDEIYMEPQEQQPRKLSGTSASMWANAPSETRRRPRRRSFREEPAYIDGDPTLTAPRKPPNNRLTYNNSNHKPINKDPSWTSIYR